MTEKNERERRGGGGGRDATKNPDRSFFLGFLQKKNSLENAEKSPFFTFFSEN